MAEKKKPAADATVGAKVEWAVATIGEDEAKKDAVLALLKKEYPKETFSENTVGAETGKARATLNFKPLRKKGASKGKDTDASEPTLSDLIAARELVSKFGAEKIEQVLNAIDMIGSAEKIRASVKALEKLGVK